MRRMYVFLCMVVVAISFFSVHSAAQSNFGIGFGLSTPNNQLNSVYNTDRLEQDQTVWGLFRESTDLGWHLGAKYRFVLGDNVRFLAGISLHRFPESRIFVQNPNVPGDTIAILNTTQNVIPIVGGIEYPFLRSVIGLYISGELSYNYFINSVDVEYAGMSIPFGDSQKYSRVGAGIGLGTEIDLKLLILDLNVKYNHANLIGKDSGEPDKTFVTVTLSACFGSLYSDDDDK